MLTISNILKKHGYTLDKLIGKGNTSECYLIDNPQFGQKQFVCKIIDLVRKDGNQHSIEAATKEIQILSQMDHPNIIRCYDYFQEDNTLFAVLEYCKNGNMADLILSHNPIEYSKLHDFSIQLVDAVSFLHLNNIAHLDITPANILFTEYDKLKLSSFGNSIQIQKGEKTNLKVGTKYFRAPEIGNGFYDPFYADIFSLGITLLVMAKKEVAIALPIVQDYLPYLIKETESLGELGNLIKECINPNPAERPNAFQLLDKLRGIVNHNQQPSSSKSYSSLKHLVGFSRVSSKLILNKNKTAKHAIALSHSKLNPYKSAPCIPTKVSPPRN